MPPAPDQAFTDIDEDWQANPDPGVAHQPFMVLIRNCWAGVQYEGHVEDDEEMMRACTSSGNEETVLWVAKLGSFLDC